MNKKEFKERDEFNLKYYDRIIVTTADDEIIVDIENNNDGPIIIKDGYKVILRPIYQDMDLEEYK